MIINLGRNSLEISRLMGFVQGNPAALLLVEFYGENEKELRSKLDEMEAALKREKTGYAFVRASPPHHIIRSGESGLAASFFFPAPQAVMAGSVAAVAATPPSRIRFRRETVHVMKVSLCGPSRSGRAIGRPDPEPHPNALPSVLRVTPLAPMGPNTGRTSPGRTW